jgi:hypothetical protein
VIIFGYKIDIDQPRRIAMEKEPEAVKEFRENVISAAAEAIIASMTPQMMRACFEGILQHVIQDLSTERYGGLRGMVKGLAEREMKVYLETDEAKAPILAAVRQGVRDATESLSEEVKGKVVDAAVKSVYNALTFKPSRY